LTLYVITFYTHKMSKLSYILHKNDFNIRYIKATDYNAILNLIIEDAFPDESYIEESLKKLQRKHRDIHDQINPLYLVFHTRNTNWLASYLSKVWSQLRTKKFANTNLAGVEIPLNEIKKYIKKSSVFDISRCNYEHKIIKQYIKLLKMNEDAFLIWKEDKEPDCARSDYDVFFRTKVCHAMRTMGISNESIERTLEMKRGLWFEHVKKIMYKKQFNDPQRNFVIEHQNMIKTIQPDLLCRFQNIRHELYSNWSALYEYEYYQKHKETIDKVKNATQAMKMNESKLKNIRKNFEVLNSIYDVINFNLVCMIKEKLADKTKVNQNNQIEMQPFQEVVTPVQVSYWDNHQPQNNYQQVEVPKKCKVVIRKTDNKEKKLQKPENYWNIYQPESYL